MLFVEIDTGLNLHRLSIVGVDGGTYWWDNKIVSNPNIHLTYPDSGGYVRPSFGDIVIANDVFITEWPPPSKVTLSVFWGDDADDTNLSTLAVGTAFLSSITESSVTYKLWEKELEVDLLLEGVNELEEDIVIPIIFGTVEHVIPQRTGTDVEFKYYKSNIAGTAGVDWHVYDDGVLVDSNILDNGDGTFNLTASPVGAVSMSGYGEATTISEIFAWACSSERLDISYSGTNVVDVPIDTFVTSQDTIESFLDRVAGWANHVFWFNADYSSLTLNSRSVDNGTSVIDEFEFMSSVINRGNPIKKLTSEWVSNIPATDSTGHFLDSEDHEVTHSVNSVGEEISLTPLNLDETTIETRLSELATSWSLPRCSVTIPLEGYLIPSIMKKVSFVDNSNILPLVISINVLKVEYVFKDSKMVIEGPGTVGTI